MRFSNKQAEKDLKRLHKKEFPLLLVHGILVLDKEIDDRQKEIAAFFDEDDETKNSDRRFFRHKADKSLDEMISAAPDESDTVSLESLDESDRINIGLPDESDAVLGISDQIEDPRLLSAWLSLKPMDREVIVLHKFSGYSLKELSVFFDTPYDTMKSRYLRAIAKMKKFF